MAIKFKSTVRVKDRISDLPDAILCHILSFIPTKYAVRTSTFSTRWKKVWASVPCLDFCPKDFDFYESFLMFVNRLLLYRGSSDIQKFRLRCLKDDRQFPLIDGWICTAIMRHVVELDLDVPGGSRIFELPRSLFICRTLRVLKLMSSFAFDTPKSWCLPSLKVLVVTVDRPDNDPMRELLPHCPAIEDLTIKGSVGQRVISNFHISALQLKTLTIILETREDDHFPVKNAGTLIIRAPKLENLDIDQRVLSLYLLDTAKSFAKATIHLSDVKQRDNPAFANRTTTLLAQISDVKYLSLSAHCLEACHLPIFRNLRQLELVLHYCCSWWPELLKTSPNLESLVLDHSRHPSWRMDSCEFTWLQWNSPESVPSCVLSQLKTICIRNFRGEPDEMKVAKYLLEKGQVLKILTLYTAHLVCSKEKLCMQLLMFYRGSKTCHVELK